MKHHALRWGILLLIGIGVGLLIKAGMTNEGEVADSVEAPVAVSSGTVTSASVPGAEGIGGAFSLIDQDGNAFTDQNLRGSYSLIFFGFTYCPMVCPTELQKMALVMDGVGDTAEKIQPVFITVDPARDTPETIKNYIEQFHPKLVGLTGAQEQIDAVMKAYHVYASKVESEYMDGYMMNHSAFTYLMGPDGELVAIYPEKDTAEDIVKDIQGRAL